MKLIPAAILSAVALLATAPTSAAVIQAGPVDASFGGDQPFNPGFQGLGFDAGLGTLNNVTLSFAGTISVAISGLVAVSPPYPAAIDSVVSVSYRSGAPSDDPRVTLAPIAAPLTVREDGLGTAFASVPRSFELNVPGGDYVTGSFVEGRLYADQRFNSPFAGVSSNTEAGFRGTISALFDYTPAARDVPEPASLALLGIGLAGLAAARRRAG